LVVVALALTSGCGLVGSTTDSAQTNDVGGVIDPVEARFPALADAAVKSCSGYAGSWTITGAVRNPTSSPLIYTLVVDLVDKTGGTVSEVDASPGAAVKPGAIGTWTASDGGAPATVTGCRVGSVTRYTP
jgi:hypothetical protein